MNTNWTDKKKKFLRIVEINDKSVNNVSGEGM